MLNIALPKGRLGGQIFHLLEKSGGALPDLYKEAGRKLVLEVPESNLRYFLVKPADVPVYVEKGAADIGVAGKDTLMETTPDIYELMDLDIGKCRFAVAAPVAFQENPLRPLRVATKYVNLAKQYYGALNREIEIIKLNGSVELAPLTGLSDVIVDIVETGGTLKENNLKVIAHIAGISARLIANKSSYKFKSGEITAISLKLKEVLSQ